MADEPIRKPVIALGFKLDRSGLDEANKATDELIEKGQRAGSVISESISKGFSKFDDLSNRTHKLTSDFGELTGKTRETGDQMTRSLRDAASAFSGLHTDSEKAGSSISSLTEQTKKYRTSVTSMSKTVRNLTRDTSSLGKESATAFDRSVNSAAKLKRTVSGFSMRGMFSGLNSSAQSSIGGLNSVKSKTEETGGAFHKMHEHVSSIGSAFAGTFLGSAIGNGISNLGSAMVGAAKQGLQLASAGELTSKQWQQLGLSKTQIKGMGDELSQIRGVSDITGGNIKNMQMQFYALTHSAPAAQKLTETMAAFGKEAGLGGDQIEALVPRINRLTTSSTVSASLFQRTIGRVPALRQAVVDGSGETQRQFDKVLSSGKLTGSGLQKDLIAAAKNSGQAWKDYGSTTTGMLDMLKGTFTNFLADSSKKAASVAHSGVASLADTLMSTNKNGKTQLSSTGSGLAEMAGNAEGSVASAGAGLLKEIVRNRTLIDSSLKDIGAAFKGTFTTVSTIIKGFTTGLIGAGNSASNAKSKMDMKHVTASVVALGASMKTFFTNIQPVVKPLGEIAGEFARGVWDTVSGTLKVISTTFGAMTGHVNDGQSGMKSLADVLSDIASHKRAIEVIGGSVATIFAIGKVTKFIGALKGVVAGFDLIKTHAAAAAAIEAVANSDSPSGFTKAGGMTREGETVTRTAQEARTVSSSHPIISTLLGNTLLGKLTGFGKKDTSKIASRSVQGTHFASIFSEGRGLSKIGDIFRNSKMLTSLPSKFAEGGKLAKVGTAASAIKSVGSKVPLLDVGLSMIPLIGMNDKNKGNRLGQVGGGLAAIGAGMGAGALAGGSAGSAAGPVGTIVGVIVGAVGGLLFPSLGGKIGTWLQKNFHPAQFIEKKFKEIHITNPFANFHPVEWFDKTMSGFHPIKAIEGAFKGIHIPNPFADFHPVKAIKLGLKGLHISNPFANMHPVKWIESQFKGIKIPNPFSKWHPIQAAKKQLAGLGNQIMAPINTAVGLIAMGFDAMKKPWARVKSYFSGQWKSFKKSASKDWSNISKPIGTAFNKIWSGMKSKWSGFSNWMSSHWKSFKKSAASDWSGITKSVSSTWGKVWGGMKSKWNGFKSGMESGWKSFSKQAGSDWNSITKSVSTKWGKVWGGLKSTWNGFSSWISGHWSTFKKTVSNKWSDITSGMSYWWNKKWTSMKGTWSTFSGWIGGQWTSFKKSSSDLWSSITKPISDAWDNLIDSIKDKWNGFKSWFGQKFSWVGSTTKGIESFLGKAEKKGASITHVGSGSHAAGGAINQSGISLVGEEGYELLTRHNQHYMIGEGGPQFMHLKGGDQIYSHAKASQMISNRMRPIHGFAAGTVNKPISAIKPLATSLPQRNFAVSKPSATSGSVLGALNRIISLLQVGSRSNSKSSAGNVRVTAGGVSGNSKSKAQLKQAGLDPKNWQKSLNGWNNTSKKLWNSNASDTRSKTNGIQKVSTKNYNSATKDMNGSMQWFGKRSNSAWNGIYGDTKSSTNAIYKQGTNRISALTSDTVASMKSLRKQFESISTDMVDFFGDVFKKLGPYARKGMSSAINNLNGGIKGIDVVIGKFGGNNDVLPTIKYAQGSNGPIAHDQLAVVNDANWGSRQEAIIHADGSFNMPKGDNVVTPVRAGDSVLNGQTTRQYQDAGLLPHFANGTGKHLSTDALTSLADKNASNPSLAFHNEFAVNVGSDKGKPDVTKAMQNTAVAAIKSVGVPWTKAMWSLINNKISGGADGSASGLLAAVEKYGTGHKYVWGATGPETFDCSGLVQYALRKAFGINYPRTSGAQIAASHKISSAEAKPGDLVGNAEHIGVYAGNGKYFSAESPSAKPNIGMGSVSYFPGTPQYGRVAGMKDTSSKSSKAKTSSKLDSLVKQEIGPKALKWIGDNLGTNDADVGPTATPAQARKVIMKAMRVAGVSGQSWLDGLETIAQHESGFRNVTNTSDSNAAAGHPSTGWFQMIPSTFKAYAKSGYGNTNNPLDQGVSAISYIKSRYGGIGGVPGLVSMRHGGPYKGYAKGGHIKAHETAVVGEKGWEIFTPDHGGTITPHNKSKGLLTDKTGAKVSVPVSITINGNASASDASRIAKAVQQGVNKVFSKIFDANSDELDSGGVF